MNLFYETYPESIVLENKEISIITDFRDIIRFMDMLNDSEMTPYEKTQFALMYFAEIPDDIEAALMQLCDFINMSALEPESNLKNNGKTGSDVFDFAIDYPYIFAGFLCEYRINLRTIEYLHWWEFIDLFKGLSDKTEIKQRMMYRSIDLGTIKDKEERNRIRKIQEAIKLPNKILSDADIANAFM